VLVVIVGGTFVTDPTLKRYASPAVEETTPNAPSDGNAAKRPKVPALSDNLGPLGAVCGAQELIDKSYSYTVFPALGHADDRVQPPKREDE